MKGLRGTGPLIWQRIATSWRLLAVLAFGMLVASTLLAASPVYTRVMNDLGLESSLKNRLGKDTRSSGIQVGMPFGSEATARESLAITQIVQEEVGWITESTVRYGSLPPMDYSRDGERPTTLPLRPLIQLQSQSDFDDHVRLIEGRFATPTGNPNEIEITVPAESARVFKLKLGDRVVSQGSYDDCVRQPPTTDPEEAAARARFRCVPGVLVTLKATVTVVGIVEQIDPNEAYWSGSRVSFATPLEVETESLVQGPIMTAVVPEESYYSALPALLPLVPVQFQISSFADLSKIDSAQLPAVRESIATMRQRLEDHGAIADTPMGFALADFNQRASFNQVTLLLLLLQVVGIAIYYVLLVSSLLVERRSEEIAMLRSRGASVMQVVGLAAAEAGLLALLVALVAPFLASAVVSLLGLTGTFESVSGGSPLPFTIVPSSFLLGLAGAILAAFTVVIPAYFTARQGMVLFLRGNARPGKPFMQRYYLDVGLVGLAALALWQVNQRGSVFDPESVGGWSADPLLLLSPLLIIVAVGALMFRFLPFILSIFGRIIAATSGPPAVTLGLWQMTRSPSRYLQLSLLVVMAAAVGTFAATYGATTEQSQQDRARFEAGVDLRITRLNQLERYDMDALEEFLNGVPGVTSAGGVLRSGAFLGPLADSDRPVEVLAIDPETASSQLWFRDDFADRTLPELMTSIQGASTEPGGLDLGDAAGVSLWINPTAPRANTLLWLRTVDARGIYRLHEVSRLGFQGFEKFTVDFSREVGEIAYPIKLAGILMTQPNVSDLTRGQLLIDDIAVLDAAGNETIVEDFEGTFRWDLLRTPTRTRDSLQQGTQGAYRGNGAAQYSFLAGQSTSVRGLYFADPNVPLAAIASSSFLSRNGLSVGEEAELLFGSVLMPVTIVSVVDYFPTMDDTAAGFIVVNARHLFTFSELTLQTNGIRPNEAWLSLSGGEEERNATYAALANQFAIPEFDTVSLEELLNSVNNDPIIRAGGSGVLLIALVAAFAILGLGFGLTLYLGGQARSLEVSVLRAVGLAPRQVFTMICLEYLLVALIGLGVGTFAGLRISETMLDFLNVTEDGSRLLPPFALSTRWDTVAIAFLATGVAFLVGIIALAGYFLRLPVSRVLRLTR